MNEVIEATIKSAIAENDVHQHYIERCRDLLSPIFPLDVPHFSLLDEAAIGHIDQFIYRFTRMQDSLGTRFLPSLHGWLENSCSPQPFIDVLHRLEQLGVLTSGQTWQFFRNLRGSLVHDYPDSADQTITTLNILHAEIQSFIDLYQQSRKAWVSRVGEP